MKHKQDLRSAIAVNKKSMKVYEIVVDKYSNGYQVMEGPDFLKGLRSNGKRLPARLTSNTLLTKVERKAH